MSAIYLNIEDDLKNKLEAKEMNMDTSSLIVKALQDFFCAERLNKVRESLGKHAKKQGFENEDDIFREIS